MRTADMSAQPLMVAWGKLAAAIIVGAAAAGKPVDEVVEHMTDVLSKFPDTVEGTSEFELAVIAGDLLMEAFTEMGVVLGSATVVSEPPSSPESN